MNVKRYDFDCCAFYDSARLDVQECDDGDYVLHSDYAALLARHNALRHNTKVIIKAYRENRKELDALREAVAWERETDNCGEWLHIAWWDVNEIDLHEIWDIYEAARAEVDRLLMEEK